MASSTPRVQPFSWTGGYNVTSPRAVASIAQRYGDPMTRWLAAPQIRNPNLSATGVVGQDEQMLRTASDKASRDNQVAADTAQRESNAAVDEVAGNIRAASPMIANMDTEVVQSPYTVGSRLGNKRAVIPGVPSPTGFVNLNPNTGSPIADPGFRSGGEGREGGERGEGDGGYTPSSGYYPRVTRSPGDLGSQTSADIRGGWGWPDTAMGDTGAQIWSRMTQDFNKSAAARQTQQNRAQALAQAKAKLAREFGPAIPSLSGRSEGGGLEMPEEPATGSTGFDYSDSSLD